MYEQRKFLSRPEPEADRLPARRQPDIAYLILFLIACLPYSNTLLNGFVYDDNLLILDNPAVQNFHHLRQITTEMWAFVGAAGVYAKYFRPVMNLSYIILHEIYGNVALGFHIANLALAGCVACLIYGVTLRWTSSRRLAWVAGVIFALHPIHSETVAWIADITDLEVAVYLLAAFWIFITLPETDNPPWGRCFLMAAAFGVAILSKETAAPFLIVAVIFEHGFRADREKTLLSTKVQRYAPFWVVFAAYLSIRWGQFGGMRASVSPGPPLTSGVVLTGFALLGKYISKLFWPVHLLAYYVFPPRTKFFDPTVLAGVLALVSIVGLIVILRRRQPVISFGLVWFLFFLAPALNSRWVISAGFAERYLFVPSIGFAWVMAVIGTELWRRSVSPQSLANGARLLPCAPLMLIAATLGACSVARIWTRNRDWRDDQTLYETTLKDEPHAVLIRVNLGAVYANQGKLRQAKTEWLRAAQESPQFGFAWTNLAMIAIHENDLASAESYLQHAFESRPVTSAYYEKYAMLREKQGRMAEAEDDLHQAIELSPLDSFTRLDLARIYLAQGQRSEAAEQVRWASEGATTPEAWCDAGDLYLQLGKLDVAEQAYRSALELNSFHPCAHGGLGQIYEQHGERDKAREEYKAVLVMDPLNPLVIEGLRRLGGARVPALECSPASNPCDR